MKPLYKTLLIIGIAMGVVATSLIFGVGQGMVMHIREKDPNDLDIYAVYQPTSSGGITGMTLHFAREIAGWLPDDVTASAVTFDRYDAEVKIGAEFFSSRVVGVDAGFATLFDLDITEGRFFSKEDQDNRSRVCVVTNDLVDLFGREALSSFMINGVVYEVIGAVQGDVNLASLMHGNYSSSSVFLPIETWYEQFEGSFYAGVTMQLAVHAPGYSKADLNQLVSQNLINMESAPTLKVATPNEKNYNAWARDLLILAGIFFVAFLVFLLAGLNIIQIASANVYDQQRVFGLKVALGALPKHLAGEITGEIVACALQGGYLGIVLAGIVNTIMNHYVGMYWAAFNIFTAIAGMILALLVGWITSVIPARQAARIDPVAVLRQER